MVRVLLGIYLSILYHVHTACNTSVFFGICGWRLGTDPPWIPQSYYIDITGILPKIQKQTVRLSSFISYLRCFLKTVEEFPTTAHYNDSPSLSHSVQNFPLFLLLLSGRKEDLQPDRFLNIPFLCRKGSAAQGLSIWIHPSSDRAVMELNEEKSPKYFWCSLAIKTQ